MPTVVPTGNGGDLVATFLAKHNAGHEATGQKLLKPVDAITGRDSKALVASSLVKLRGTCNHGQPSTQPIGTISAQGNHFAEVRAFLMKYHRDGGQLAGSRAHADDALQRQPRARHRRRRADVRSSTSECACCSRASSSARTTSPIATSSTAAPTARP
jgi:hypothetical protein